MSKLHITRERSLECLKVGNFENNPFFIYFKNSLGYKCVPVKANSPLMAKDEESNFVTTIRFFSLEREKKKSHVSIALPPPHLHPPKKKAHY